MKPGAFLVNISRGPIMDGTALIDVLRAGTIAGAALNVYDVEPPPPSHPFRGLDNVVLLPHLGYVTWDTFKVTYPQTLECIEGWLAGSPIRMIGD